MTCPMCGHEVRVRSGDEGTSSYEPVGCSVALLRRLLDENKGDPDGEKMVSEIAAYLEGRDG